MWTKSCFNGLLRVLSVYGVTNLDFFLSTVQYHGLGLH